MDLTGWNEPRRTLKPLPGQRELFPLSPDNPRVRVTDTCEIRTYGAAPVLIEEILSLLGMGRRFIVVYDSPEWGDTLVARHRTLAAAERSAKRLRRNLRKGVVTCKPLKAEHLPRKRRRKAVVTRTWGKPKP